MAGLQPLSNFLSEIQSASAATGVPQQVLAGVLAVESGNGGTAKTGDVLTVNPYATSSAGAEGIAQFLPSTAASVGVANPYDPAQAIPGAATYLESLYKQFGSWTSAIEAYNAGPGNVASLGVNGAAALPGADPAYLSKVSNAASVFAASVGATATPTPIAASGAPSATSTSSTTGTASSSSGAMDFLGLQAVGNAITNATNTAATTAQTIALDVFLGGLAIALIAGGIAWLAQSNPGVQEAEGRIAGAAAKT